MNKAPWNAETVKSLNHWQSDGKFHPYTCANGRDERHLDGEGVLIATENGWKCPYCEYTQDWAHK